MSRLDYVDTCSSTESCGRNTVTEITAAIDTKLIITRAIFKSTKINAHKLMNIKKLDFYGLFSEKIISCKKI